MKAFVLDMDEGIGLREVPIPKIGPDEALVRIVFAGICGTDLHILNRFRNFEKYKEILRRRYILGHEWSGEIAKVGKTVKEFEVGDRVIGEGMIGCGRCRYCKTGRYNLCLNYQEIGFHLDGAFAEFVKIPAKNLYKIPDTLTFEEAALLEPMAVVVHGLDLIGVDLGATVAVLGPGPIGLITIQVVKVMGAFKTILTGTREGRLKVGRELGADLIININKENCAEIVNKFTDNQGVDLVVEAAGNTKALRDAFNIVAKGGKILLLGVAAVPPSNLRLAIGKELTIKGSLAQPNAWTKALALVASGRVKVKPLISLKMPLDRIEEAFKIAETQRDEVIKMLIKP